MSVMTLGNTDHEIAGKELAASRVDWKRLRRLALHVVVTAGAVGGTAFYLSSGFSGLLLRADGHIVRDQVTVSPVYEGRVAEMLVRPGDRVEKGQKIAVVKSVTVSRTLADLEIEKARLVGKIAEAEARQQVIRDTLPLAKSSAERAAHYLKDLNEAEANGLAVRKSLQEMTAASLSAEEHVTALRAELNSLSSQLDASRVALTRVSSAYDELSGTYANGALYASASGDIGTTVAPVGQALATGSGAVADIFTGVRFVRAYVPDSYLFEITEGQPVSVKAGNVTLTGRIERTLPLAENLPSDLQRPNRVIERGRLVRIALPDASKLPMDQRVRISSCFTRDCSGLKGIYQTVMSIGSDTLDLVQQLATLRPSVGTL